MRARTASFPAATRTYKRHRHSHGSVGRFGDDAPAGPSRPSGPSRCCGKALPGVRPIYDRPGCTPWWQDLIRAASFAATSASSPHEPGCGRGNDAVREVNRYVVLRPRTASFSRPAGCTVLATRSHALRPIRPAAERRVERPDTPPSTPTTMSNSSCSPCPIAMAGHRPSRVGCRRVDGPMPYRQRVLVFDIVASRSRNSASSPWPIDAG